MTEDFKFVESKIARTVSRGDHSHTSWLPRSVDSPSDPESAWWQTFLRGAVAESAANSRKIRSVDAFAGCGGLSLGAAEAARAIGFALESIAAVDVDVAGLRLHQANFGTRQLIQENVSSLLDWHVAGEGDSARFAYEPEILLPELAKEVGRVDLFLAGPPCQGHSNFNNRTRRQDPRNLLYVSAATMGIALQANIIVIENVPDVINDKSEVVATAKALLTTSGYNWTETAVLALDQLGGPQTRKRFFLVACRQKPEAEITFPVGGSDGAQKAPRSLEWAIGDLLHDKNPYADYGVMDSVPILSSENAARIRHLFQHGLHDLPDAERPLSHVNGNTYPSVYGRLWWDRPAQTITTGFLTPGRGRHVHPLVQRVISPHEAARIQTFPDSYRFAIPDEAPPSRSSLQKWIGDAVPPMLGYHALLPVLAGAYL